ncbi:MAG: immunoglobulin domain-containing protein [Planctomycetota bacterium]
MSIRLLAPGSIAGRGRPLQHLTVLAVALVAAWPMTFAGPPSCPLDGTGLVLHLETDVGLATVGSTVTGWTDQSSAANDLVAAGAPQVMLGALNGHDVIRFDGVSDFLERTANLNALPTGNANRTAFVVARYNGPGFSGVSYGTAVCNQAFSLGTAPNGNLEVQGWCAANDFITADAGVGAGWQIHGAVHDGGLLAQYRDGFWIDSVVHAFDTQPTRLVVGQELNGSAFVPVDVAAVLVYDRALTAAERLAVETYLLEKYFGTVCGANLPPFAADAMANVASGQSVLLDPISGAQDRDGSVNRSSVTLVTAPTFGVVAIDPVSGAITYTHGGAPSLLDTFSFTVSDDLGTVSNVAHAWISIGSESCPLPPRGLVLLLESEVGVSVSGAEVTGWADQSFRGNDLVPTGDPMLLAGALGSHGAIQLDGFGDTLERTLSLNGFPDGNGNRSMFALVRYQSVGFGGMTYGTAACNQAFGLTVDQGGDLTVTRWCNDLDTNFPGNGAGWIVQSANLQFGRVEHYLDALLIDVRTNDFATANDRFVIGAELDGDPHVVMDVAAILLYDRALAPAEHAQVISYLQSKYLGAACGGNAPPTADDDFARVTVGQSVAIDVLDGDTDDGMLNPATVVVGTPPLGGTVAVDPQTGVVTYTRTAADLVADRFTYTVRDNGSLLSNAATVFVAVDAAGCPLITDGLVVHLEAGVGVFASGSTVLDWADASGFGNDLVGRDGPQLIPNALNGHAVIRLDGVDDFLERDLTLNGLPQGSADRSLFYVVNYIAGGPGGLGYGTTTCNQVFSIIVRTNGTLMLVGWCGANSFATIEPGTGEGWFTHAAILDADAYTHYKAGNPIDTGTHVFNTVTANGGLVVGSEVNGNTFVEMDVAEVLIYDRALPEADRLEVEAYLNEKYFGQVCCVATAITQQPVDRSACAGEAVSFAVSASGTDPISYQWRKDGIDIPGAQSATLVVDPVGAADAGSYDVLVANACGSELSSAASLDLLDAVLVVTEPQDTQACVGAAATFEVIAAGAGPLTYQWFRGAVAVPGAVGPVLTIAPVAPTDQAVYSVVITGACGPTTSQTVSLTVLEAPQVLVGPAGLDPCEGTPLSLAVVASGTEPLAYQWFKDGLEIVGANAALFEIPAASAIDAGSYTVQVSNACGAETSAPAVATVRSLPQVDVQPVMAEDCVGAVVMLTVQASGTAPLGYQWRRNGVNVPGANASTLMLNPLAPADAGSYDVEISNSCGVVVSDTVPVVVLTAPVVVLSPMSATPCEGDMVTLSIMVTGSAPLTYQWRKDGMPIAGAEAASFTIGAVQAADTGSYDVEVSNPCGSAVSGVATLDVLVAPSILTAPSDAEVCEGQALTLAVVGAGPGLMYQWQRGGVPLVGQQAETLTIDPLLPSDAGSYDVVVTNPCGSVTSPAAAVTVRELPAVVTEPMGGSVCENDAFTLSVVATGFEPLSYEWRQNGSPIPGATGASLVLAQVTSADVGIYDVSITNVCGATASTTVMIDLLPPAQCGEVFKRGDVNQDGTVNIVDALAGLNYLFIPGSAVPQCFDGMDANDDGALNLLDPVSLLLYLFVPGSAPPAAPGPLACGLDPTSDALPLCDYTAACP